MTKMNPRAILPPSQVIIEPTQDIEFLFAKYTEIGFLYPAKRQLLAPHFRQITQNWQTLVGTPEQLLWTLTARKTCRPEDFASIAVWRQSNYGLIAQHLVSTGNPVLSLRTMLRAQEIVQQEFTENEVRSSQNWFRPDNRYAYRVFASLLRQLGDQEAALLRHQYLLLPLEQVVSARAEGYRAEAITTPMPEFVAFVRQQYGEVFVAAEELDQPDLLLEGIGRIYRSYQCERYRQIVGVRDSATGRLVGCAVANRAPLGLNFSFLENRAYFILAPELSSVQRALVVRQLGAHLRSAYADIPIGAIPVATDPLTAATLQADGATWLREYMQSIWLRAGFPGWYAHIDSFLQRITRRGG
jgi:hypothetical protein